MNVTEIVGYAVFSLCLIAAGVALSHYQPATLTGNDGLPWACFMTAFAILTLGALCFVSGTSIAALSFKSVALCWLVISALLAFGLYVNWRLYFREVERFSEVLFEWTSLALIYGFLLILPRLLRGAAESQ